MTTPRTPTSPTTPTPAPDAEPTFASAFRRVGDTVNASIDLVGHVLRNVDRLVGDVRRDSVRIARDSEALYRDAVAGARGVRDAVRATPRFTRIVGEGARLIAAYRFHAARAAAGGDRDAARLEAVHDKSARRLYELCVELRGGVLKLGQFVSCRADLLPRAYARELGKLQDRVPPVPTEEIVGVIEDELGAPIGELFSRFDPEPIAAASLAQVHAAALPNGTEVAVKVQIPGIQEIVETDLAALRTLAGILGQVAVIPGADVTTIAAELRRSLAAELDYETEAANVSAFAACFADDERIVVPAVYASHSARRVLTLERIDGARLTDYLDDCEQRGDDGAADRDRLFEILVGSFCAQVLEHGFLHADPHPGNFLVTTNAGVGLAVLDFGSVQRYTPQERAAYANVAAAALTGDAARVAELLVAMGFETEGGDATALVGFAELLLESFREDAIDPSSIDPEEQLERALELARTSPVVAIPQSFVMLGRVFTSLGGLYMRYRPATPLFPIIARYLAASLHSASGASTNARGPTVADRSGPAKASSAQR